MTWLVFTWQHDDPVLLIPASVERDGVQGKVSVRCLTEVRATLAMNLRTIRLSKGIAQERLALDAGVDRTVVSKIERAVTNPSIEILLKLANQLDVDLNDLFAN